MKKAQLEEISYSASGICSICGDILLSSKTPSGPAALEALEKIFEEHILWKHAPGGNPQARTPTH